MTQHLADHHSRTLEIVEGDGCYVTDINGKRYLDFTAGWCVGSIGWKHPEAIVALKAEAEHGRYVPPLFRFAAQEAFAAQLIEIAPGNRLNRAYRCTSGSEAVEMAIQCARAATGKNTIVSIDEVYHGHTYGAASVGEACKKGDIGECLTGFIKLPLPKTPELAEQAVKQLEQLLTERTDIAAFLSEPVWSNAGVYIPPADFYPRIHALCRQHNVLLIMDEVATGFGRCGTLFACELWDLEPDILCLGKAITGGYGTLAATLVSEEIYQQSNRIPDYSTFGWVPLDLAAASAVVGIIVRDNLADRSAQLGTQLLEELKPLAGLPHITAIRGQGLLVGIEIVSDSKPDYRLANQYADKAAEAGLLIETAGNALFLSPPLILNKNQLTEGVRILSEALS